jgi:DNA phosphorothioation-dependent restriction protein DptH
MVDNLTGDLTKISITELEDKSGSEDEESECEEDKPDDDRPDNQVDPEPDDTETEEPDENQTEESGSMHILFGRNEQDGKPVIWKPNDTTQLFHTNTGIIGTMGTGKTQFTKSLIAQLHQEQSHNVDGQKLGILIFDYKGDYNESKADFVETTNAKILKPYHLPFNPLALTKSNVFKPLLPIHTANAFKDTISKVYGLGPKQQDTLFQCIIETYQTSGIAPGNPSSWENEVPTFDQVYQRYANDEEIKKNDSLAAAMNKLHQFEVFESNPSNTKSLFDILDGVVVIDLSGYDSDIQSLIVAITLDLFYAQMQASGSSKMEGNYRQLTKLILVDEADNFMSEGFPSLKKILKEGREFGVGTILSTQFLKHFGSGEDDYAKYILTWVVHNVSDLKNSDVEFVFNSESKSQENQVLYNAIKGLTKHHSIIKIGNNKPVYVQDKAFWELYKELH